MDADLASAVHVHLVHVKGALRRKSPSFLALFSGSVGLFDVNGKAVHSWRFAEDDVTVAAGVDADDVIVTVRGKASGVRRMMGRTDSETRWVLSVSGCHRSDVITRVLSMRQVSLGEIPEPVVFMGTYAEGARAPANALGAQPVQLLVGAFSLAISSAADGELLLDLSVCGMQRIRRLGDVSNAFAIRHLQQWHVVVCDERDQVIALLREKCDLVGLSTDIIFGTSLPSTQIEKEAGADDTLRASATEWWGVLLQAVPKEVATTARWRDARPRKRTLMLTPTHLLECDPESKSEPGRLLWARQGASVRVISRWLDQPERFTIGFADGHTATYESTQRDRIVALIFNCLVMAAEVQDMQDSLQGAAVSRCPARIGLWAASSRLRLVAACASREAQQMVQHILVKRLAALVDSGVLLGADDDDVVNPLVVAAAADVCANCHGMCVEGDGREVETIVKQIQGRQSLDRGEPSDILTLFECMKLLLSSQSGWVKLGVPHERGDALRRAAVSSIVMGLNSRHEEIVLSSLGVLLSLVTPPSGSIGLGQEVIALRDEVLTDEVCQQLGRALSSRCSDDRAVLSVLEILRIYQTVITSPASRFSSARLKASCTASLLSDNGLVTILVGHTCRAVSAGAWLVVQEMVDAAVDDGLIKHLCAQALSSGAMLKHFAALLHPDVQQQQLSRRLCAVWMADQDCSDARALLARCLPLGMLPTHSFALLPSSVASKGEVGGVVEDEDANAGLRTRAEWEKFFQDLLHDKDSVSQRWNEVTRQELRVALESEATKLFHDSQLPSHPGHTDTMARCDFAWNHEDFLVVFPSLEKHLRVQNIFVGKTLAALRKKDVTADDVFQFVPDLSIFFNDLYGMLCKSTGMNERVQLLEMMRLCADQAVIQEDPGASIFCFHGLPHLVDMLRKHRNAAERDALLMLLRPLLSRKANALEFVRAGGLCLLVHMAAMVHVDRQGRSTGAALTSKMIEASSVTANAREEFRFWFCKVDDAPSMPAGSSKSSRSEQRDADVDEETVLSKPGHARLLLEIKQDLKSQTLTLQSLVRNQHERDWKMLQDFDQLVWIVGVDGAGKSMAEVSIMSLHIVQDLCSLFPAKDAYGRRKLPAPLIRRTLLADECLCHLVQLLLAGYPHVVDMATSLLADLLLSADVARLRSLYKTGFFFFALAYSGSGLEKIVTILKHTHLCQDFYRKDNVMLNQVSSRNSILHGMVPESIICFLSNHDPNAFSEMMMSDSNTPEAIWRHTMRHHLISSLSLHFNDFSQRLREDFLAVYEYVPLLTQIEYAELDGELWVPPYFLHNLANTEVFADWPIIQPFDLLRAVIDLWTREQYNVESRQQVNGAMTENQAWVKLGLADGETCVESINKAYRRMALRYHPDKNPAGRAEFESIQEAYAVLLQRTGSTKRTGSRNVLLLIKAQAVLYTRCAAQLAQYRYPCYPALCALMERYMGVNDELTNTCVRVLALTSAVDSGNVQELVRTNQLWIVADVLQRSLACAIDANGEAPQSLNEMVCACACQAAAAVVAEEIGRDELCKIMLAQDNRLCHISRSLSSMLCQGHTPALKAAAIYVCIGASHHPHLLNHLIQAGAVWSLLATVLRFEPGAPVAHNFHITPAPCVAVSSAAGGHGKTAKHLAVPLLLHDGHTSSSDNWHSVLALWALSTMASNAAEAGCTGSGDAGVSAVLRDCLHALVTPCLARQLIDLNLDIVATCSGQGVVDKQGQLKVATEKATSLANVLATRCETPTCLWTPQMRMQLLDFVSVQQGKGIEAGHEFTFTALKDEPHVGGVFLRNLVRVPEAIHAVLNTGRLSHCILAFLAAKSPVQCVCGDVSPTVVAWSDVSKSGPTIGAPPEWDDWLDDSIRHVSAEQVQGRVLSTYACDMADWRGDVEVAVQALSVLVARDVQLMPAVPASALHILRWLPVIWALLAQHQQDDGPMSLLVDIARHWPECFAHHLTTKPTVQTGSLSSQTGWLCRFLRQGCHAQLVVGLDLLAPLICTAGPFLLDFLAHGGHLTLLAMRMQCLPPSAQAAPPVPRRDTQLQAWDKEELGERALEVLHVALTHGTHGQRVNAELRRWLPAAIVVALAQSAKAASRLLDATLRSPDLIWSCRCRQELRDALQQAHLRLSHGPTSDTSTAINQGVGEGPQVDERLRAPGDAALTWLSPSTSVPDYSEYRGLTVLGGVFLDEFVRDPSARVADEPALLDALLGWWLPSCLVRAGEQIHDEPRSFGDPEADRLAGELVWQALTILLSVPGAPHLVASLARGRHAKRLSEAYLAAACDTRHDELMPGAAHSVESPDQIRLLRVLRLVAGDRDGADAILTAGLLRALIDELRRTPPRHPALASVVEIVRLCAAQHSARVAYGLLECGAVEALLSWLQVASSGVGAEQVAVRVHAIEALKALEGDPTVGADVTVRLSNSEIWSDAKGQRHDLFLATTGGRDLLLAGPCVHAVSHQSLADEAHHPPADTASPSPQPRGLPRGTL